jgi:hypothetical protein
MKPTLSLLLLLLVAAPSAALTVYVPDDFPTIQSAIGSSINGDTIIVRQGTYFENIDFLGKAITLRSEKGTKFTFIDGGKPLNPDFGCVVIFQNNEGRDSVLDGFTITNGTGKLVNTYRIGGGIYCDPMTSPTIINNVIMGNVNGIDSAGGIYCDDGADPIIRCNVFHDNSVDSGGGALGAGVGSVPIIEDNIFRSNFADRRGGAISLWQSQAVISRNLFINNGIPGRGGAISCEQSSPIITENLFEGNRSNIYGGAIDCNTAASPTIARNTMRGNRSISGGAIACYLNCSPLIEGNLIVANSADGGAGIYFANWCSPLVANNVILDNEALSGSAGGLFCTDRSTPLILNSTFVGNSALQAGGAILCGSGSTAEIVNTILWDNTAAEGSEIAIGHTSDPAIVTIRHSDLKGGPSLVKVDPLCILEVGPGLIDADPLFSDRLEEDLHIPWNSPCRNAGDDLAAGQLALDYEGDRRVWLGPVDIGADEFHPHLYFTGTVAPGASGKIRLVGPPGAWAYLALGPSVLDPPVQTSWGVLYLQQPFLATWSFRSLPPTGILALPMTVPSSWLPGTTHPFQALEGPVPQLTNLLLLSVE